MKKSELQEIMEILRHNDDGAKDFCHVCCIHHYPNPCPVDIAIAASLRKIDGMIPYPPSVDSSTAGKGKYVNLLGITVFEDTNDNVR